MKLSRDDYKFIILIVFIVANTYLMANGHGAISSDVLKLDQMVSQSAHQCAAAAKP